ncbi:MAG: MFS transporter [Betaproteobacteria bacterium]
MGAASGARARQSVRTLFFAYFLYVGIQSPFLSLYLYEIGLGVAQIGLVMSLAPASRIVGPLAWGWLADRSHSRNLVIRMCAVLSIGAIVWLWFAGAHLGWVLAACALLFFATSGQMPIAEAVAIEVARQDSGRYSRIRVWGSIGFIIGVVGTGPLLELAGIERLPMWLVLMMGAVLLSTWMLPDSPPRAAGPRPAPLWRALRDPAKAAFFASAFLMLYAHSVFYTFFSLYLEEQGYGKTAIGLLWSVGVVAEILMFYGQRPLFLRFSAMGLLGFSVAVAAVRFTLVGASDGALWLIIFTQVLHAITFGIHHTASQALLARWFGPERQASAQALYITVGYGVGGTIGGLGASWLWVALSPAAAFYGAGLISALGCVAVWLCARRLKEGEVGQ